MKCQTVHLKTIISLTSKLGSESYLTQYNTICKLYVKCARTQANYLSIAVAPLRHIFLIEKNQKRNEEKQSGISSAIHKN